MGYCLLAILGLCVGLPLAAVIRTYWKVKNANQRFLATARRSELGADGSAELELPTTTGTQHAVWLDLDIRGGEPMFMLELSVSSRGISLAQGQGVFGFDSEGDFQSPDGLTGAGSAFSLSLESTRTGGLDGTHVETIQRVALFVPAPGDTVVVRVKVTPTPGTVLARCRVLVTDTPAP
ncbi:MAG: hypothetical protein K1X94_27800 [Sandaracinaceae bacterium]|nr:hypothetical protein [Sandaracinaceae bacterium]